MSSNYKNEYVNKNYWKTVKDDDIYKVDIYKVKADDIYKVKDDDIYKYYDCNICNIKIPKEFQYKENVLDIHYRIGPGYNSRDYYINRNTEYPSKEDIEDIIDAQRGAWHPNPWYPNPSNPEVVMVNASTKDTKDTLPTPAPTPAIVEDTEPGWDSACLGDLVHGVVNEG